MTHREAINPGQRVDVLLCEDDSQHTGTIVMVTDLWVEGELWSDSYPTIKLDCGRTVAGLDCWWTPIEDAA